MPDEDRDKYEIDEIIERLKRRNSGGAPGDGELVIRADGTAAVKVRKRKRRTHQPVREERKRKERIRFLQVAILVGCALLTAIAAGGLLAYANSPPFRDRILREIAARTGAEVTELREFRITPRNANAGKLRLEWPEGSVLREIEAVGVRSRINPAGIVVGSLSGETLECASATIHASAPAAGGTAPRPAADSAAKVDFQRISSSQTRVVFGSRETPDFVIDRTEASFQSPNPRGIDELVLNGGTANFAPLPVLRLGRAYVEFGADSLEIVSLQLSDPADEQSLIEVAGSCPLSSRGSPEPLSVKVKRLPLRSIAGAPLAGLIDATIDSSGQSDSGSHNKLTLGERPELSLEFVPTRGSFVELAGFPFLKDLASVLDDKWIEQPKFGDDGSGVLIRTRDETRIERLRLVDPARMALRIDLSLAANGSLAGTIDVGLAETLLQTAKRPEVVGLFSQESRGFRWLKLTIGGNPLAPTDNFRELVQAGVAPGGAGVLTTAPGSAVPTFEELTAPR